MLDTTALAKTVCRIVVAATGLPPDHVIVGDPNGPAPAGSYCAVRLDSPAQFAQASVTQRNVPALDDPQYQDIIAKVTTSFTLGFSVNFYRAGAMVYAAALAEANKREPIKNILRAAKLGWSRITPVNNLTGLFSAAMEERAQLTIYLYGQSVAEDRVQRIYRVGITVQSEQSDVIAQGEANGLSG